MARLQIQLADVSDAGGRLPATLRPDVRGSPTAGRLSPGAGQVSLGAGMLNTVPRFAPVDVEAAGALGRGIARAGDALGELAERHALLASEDELNRRRGEYVRRLYTAREEIERENLPTPEDAQARFRERAAEIATELGDGLSWRARLRWGAISSELALAPELRIADDARQRVRQEAVANAQEQLRLMGNEAARARNPAEEAVFFRQAEEIVQGLAVAGAINPLQRAQLLRGFGADVVQARVVGLIQSNPSAALAYLQSPQVARYLDADRVAALSLQASQRADMLAARAEAQMARRERAAASALSEFNGLLAQGIVPTERAARMLNLARGTAFEATARQMIQDAAVVQAFVSASPERQAQMLAEADARRRAPNASDVDQALFARLTQVRESIARAYDQDGIGASVALGVIPPLPPLDFRDAETLRARVEAAAGESARLGRRVSPFTREDIVGGVEQFRRADPDERLAIIQALGSMGAGPERARVMAEFERARGDGGRMPPGSIMRVYETMQAGTPEALVAARRMVNDLAADVSDRVRGASERPEFRSALESVQGRGVQAARREQAALVGGAYATGFNVDMDLIQRLAQVRMAAGQGVTEAVRDAAADVSRGREALTARGLAAVVLPAGIATDGLEAGFRALRERAAAIPIDTASGAEAVRRAQELRAAANAGVWINADPFVLDGQPTFILVAPGVPRALARATLEEVRAAAAREAAQPPPVMRREQLLEQRRREERRLPPAPTIEVR